MGVVSLEFLTISDFNWSKSRLAAMNVPQEWKIVYSEYSMKGSGASVHQCSDAQGFVDNPGVGGVTTHP